MCIYFLYKVVGLQKPTKYRFLQLTLVTSLCFKRKIFSYCNAFPDHKNIGLTLVSLCLQQTVQELELA